jgi:type I restriction enzyme S subunit
MSEVAGRDVVIVAKLKEVGDGRDTRPFGELFAEGTRNGLTRPKAVRGSGVKMVNMGELFAHPRLRNAPMDRVPLSEAEAERFLLEPGDLLFARQSLVLEGAGKCSIFLYDDEPVTFESHVTRVRLDPRKADPRFYFYYLQSHHGRSAITGIVEQGAGASGIRGSDLQKLDVLWRPVPEQRAIAHILGTLDDKIELNRRMNETLEAMARSLFKSWFVDFDPVRAKMEGRDPGLPQPLADLFPDSFEDSELGEIPRGWRVGTLVDLANLNPEVWTKETRPAEINYVDLSNTKWGRIEAVSTFQAADAPSRAQRVLRPADTIVGTVRPGNGSYALIFEHGLTGSTGFAVLRPRAAQYAEFVYLAATSGDNVETLAHLADGAAYPAVRPEVVAATPIVRSSDEVFGRFSRIAGPLLAKRTQNERESRTLAALRDALLPKLISGELRVKDAEKFLGGAL